LLALFPFALLYQRLRAVQRSTFDDLVRQAKERLRRIGPASGSNVLRRALAKRRWQPLHGLLLAYPIVVLPTILADQGRTRANEVMSVAIGLAAIVAAGCFRAILVPRRAHGTTDPRVAERRGLSWLVMLLAIAAGALAVSAVLLDRLVEQLGIGLVVAISPLAANLFAGTIKLNQRLRRHVG
jgi:hypothetical protein